MHTRALFTAAVLSCTVATPTRLAAQDAEAPAPARTSRWELVVPAGSLVPTGGQRHAIKRGSLTAVQLSYLPRRALAVTATLGWARTRDIASADDPKLDVFTYDVGAELRAPRWNGTKRVSFMPFAGVGAGARAYDYRSLDADARHNLAAYTSAGGELGVSRIRLRVEVRDYVSRFKPLGGTGATDTRNDVVVMTGVRIVRR